MVNLQIEEFGDIIIVTIEGIFNIDCLGKVERLWSEQVKKKPRMIGINCQKLDSLDSSAIGSIVKFFNYALGKGITIIFYDLNPLLQKLFTTAKLNRYFTITTRSEFENRYILEPATLQNEPVMGA